MRRDAFVEQTSKPTKINQIEVDSRHLNADAARELLQKSRLVKIERILESIREDATTGRLQSTFANSDNIKIIRENVEYFKALGYSVHNRSRFEAVFGADDYATIRWGHNAI